MTYDCMQKFVGNTMREQKAKPGIGLACIDGHGHLCEYFSSTFSDDVFYSVFYWLREIIDLERSSELGRWYARGRHLPMHNAWDQRD